MIRKIIRTIFKKSITRQSLKFIGACMCNNVPQEIRNQKSSAKFRRRLGELMIENYT